MSQFVGCSGFQKFILNVITSARATDEIVASKSVLIGGLNE